jgi:hypothetical protein
MSSYGNPIAGLYGMFLWNPSHFYQYVHKKRAITKQGLVSTALCRILDQVFFPDGGAVCVRMRQSGT